MTDHCPQCDEKAARIACLTSALAEAAGRFRNAAAELWTDGQDTQADEMSSALAEAGVSAYSSAKDAAMAVSETDAPAERGQGE